MDSLSKKSRAIPETQMWTHCWKKAERMIAEIRTENDRIPDESLTSKLSQLENLCASVFRAVYEKPAKRSANSWPMDYYLPTTLKMVKSYRLLKRSLQRIAKEARARIDSVSDAVITACQKMLQNLYKDDMLDIATDIDVLEQMPAGTD